jgi:hypothetical protein
MTICIGALCKQSQPGDTIVLAADPMVTRTGLTEFEHRVRRAHQVCRVLSSSKRRAELALTRG